MLIERSGGDVVVWAPAKVNLYLEVLARRGDGFHELETLLVAVNLYDTLVFKEDPSGQVSLWCNRPDLPTGPENLVTRAAESLRQRTGCARGARVRLHKRIPVAAGLAGGSSDCAAALAGLNRLWGLGLTDPELAELGAGLGSDVPFFLCGAPAAWCTGRGERVRPLELPRRLWLVLVCPPFGLSTAEVYRGVAVPERPETAEGLLGALAQGRVEDIGRFLHNRLQESARRLAPAIDYYLDLLKSKGRAGQLMSGSGSTLFALCRSAGEARRLARELSNEREEKGRPNVYAVRSCAGGRTPPARGASGPLG